LKKCLLVVDVTDVELKKCLSPLDHHPQWANGEHIQVFEIINQHPED